jgi:hypothetical protein
VPAILARPIASDLGVEPTFVYGALSAALVISGLLGPQVGHVIDRLGGRGVLCLSNVVLAVGLLLLAASQGRISLIAAWLVLGVGMGMGLYDAAFAALTRLYGTDARRSITGITLIAGFASTIGWPVSAFLEAHYGWRVACIVWAAVNLVLALPLNFSLPRVDRTLSPPAASATAMPSGGRSETWAMIVIAYVFAATGFVSSGLSAMLPAILVQFGATSTAAVFAATLVGPAQVAARIVEAWWLSRYHPLASTQLATVMHPLGVVALALGGPLLAPVFALAYGAGNGILTIARGTLPLAVFGPTGFGRRTGLLALPARATGAVAPLVIGLLLQYGGGAALVASSTANLSALLALVLLGRMRLVRE